MQDLQRRGRSLQRSPRFVSFTTNFCYNGVIVTSHSNDYNPGVTAAGSDAGRAYVADSQNYESHCYVANGSTRNCSGNEEDIREQFDKCSAFRGCSAHTATGTPTTSIADGQL